MQLLRKGSKGPSVKKLQRLLKVTPDGDFGPKTEKAVIRFQLLHEVDVAKLGFVNYETWTLLQLKRYTPEEAIDQDTDLSNQYYVTDYDQRIHKYFLSKDEYVNRKVKNEYVMLHHTAGGANPYRCIDLWERDKRGRIATEFVLGGQDHKTGSLDYDGVMVQAFPHGNYAYHIGRSGSGKMNKSTVGLEICSMGYLDHDHETYVGSKAINTQVIELEAPFKKKSYFHRYSDRQMEEVAKWLKFISDRDGIDVTLGLKQWIKRYGPVKAFGFQEDAYYGKVKGLLTHGNVRRDKTDVYPDPRLVDIIMSL
ncbi:MAG: N-acetylmuramoyl-L-alanine amidase [Legionellales bacterium]|nr:N-acetylmuramoyl-L-alanine amidase [Legionellales bacterium]